MACAYCQRWVQITIIYNNGSLPSSKARFDGVVGYHVSLTSTLGSLKVSSSSLGRIIFFGNMGHSHISSHQLWVFMTLLFLLHREQFWSPAHHNPERSRAEIIDLLRIRPVPFLPRSRTYWVGYRWKCSVRLAMLAPDL
jgi:hypothetical protein